MKAHEFVNSDETKFDSNCSVCDGKERDAVHTDNTARDRRDNLIALINTYNESSSPSVPRTDDEHRIERDRARIALKSIHRNYVEGRDYRELSNGALWPISQ